MLYAKGSGGLAVKEAGLGPKGFRIESSYIAP